MAYKDKLATKKKFQNILEYINDEYKNMIDILSDNGQHKIIDCARISHNG